MNYPELTDLDYEILGKASYHYDKNKKYKYIDIDTLNPKARGKIIKILEENNGMPNNFLKFVYEVNLDKIKNIYPQKKSFNNNTIETCYSPRFEEKEDYKSQKFGIVIKVNANKEKEKQLIFYCSKNQALYGQFFLTKALVTEQYNEKNLKISLPEGKKTCSKQSKNVKKGDKGVKIEKVEKGVQTEKIDKRDKKGKKGKGDVVNKGDKIDKEEKEDNGNKSLKSLEMDVKVKVK